VVIIMEYLKFGSRSDQAELGRRLAQMHLATPAVRLTSNAPLLLGLGRNCLTVAPRPQIRQAPAVYLLQGEKGQKSLKPFLNLCVSSLRRGHANLLCIVPNLSYVRAAMIAFLSAISRAHMESSTYGFFLLCLLVTVLTLLAFVT